MTTTDWNEAINPIECPDCGGIEAWWDRFDRRRCMACEPISDQAKRFIELAEKIRQKAPKTRRRPVPVSPDAVRIGITDDPCDRCGSTEYFDTPIHEGNSVRRDCTHCGRTWGFPKWCPPK